MHRLINLHKARESALGQEVLRARQVSLDFLILGTHAGDIHSSNCLHHSLLTMNVLDLQQSRSQESTAGLGTLDCLGGSQGRQD